MWDFLCDLAWTVAIIDVASMTYYAWQWYGGPVAAASGLWANGPEVVPLLTMGALAPFRALQTLYSRKDMQANFDKIEQHIKMKTFEDDVSQWKSGDPIVTKKEPGQLAQSYTALDANNFLPTNDWLGQPPPPSGPEEGIVIRQARESRVVVRSTVQASGSSSSESSHTDSSSSESGDQHEGATLDSPVPEPVVGLSVVESRPASQESDFSASESASDSEQ